MGQKIHAVIWPGVRILGIGIVIASTISCATIGLTFPDDSRSHGPEPPLIQVQHDSRHDTAAVELALPEPVQRPHTVLHGAGAGPGMDVAQSPVDTIQTLPLPGVPDAPESQKANLDMPRDPEDMPLPLVPGGAPRRSDQREPKQEQEPALQPAPASDAAASADARTAAKQETAQASESPAAARSSGSLSADLHDPPPSIDQAEPEQTVTAAVNSTFELTLPGESWIYLGEQNGSRAISFVSRTSGSGETRFSFRADSPGSYSLGFQRQDLSRGVTERSLAQADVASAADEAVANGDSASSASGNASGGTVRAADDSATDSEAPDRWSGEGGIGSQPGRGPESANLPASPAERFLNGEPLSESRPAVSPSPPADEPPVNLGGAVREGDAEAVRAALQDSTPAQLQNEFGLDTLMQAVSLVMHSDSPRGAGELLQHLSDQEVQGDDQARLLYWKGQYYESRDNRSYRDALRSYTELEERFPYHSLAEPAGIRSRYIRRHFIDIR